MTSSLKPSLNEEQKRACFRILSGEARPIPYVIYGPPGTGKTMTVVEAILQVFHLRHDSRILVATPSNSSADLIVERLHASGAVSRGEMARLNAFNRHEDAIPLHIYPPYEPRLSSHVEQVAQHLRTELLKGRWSGQMPGALKLEQEVGASHTIIDRALRLLEKDGWLENLGPGRRRRLTRRPLGIRTSAPSPVSKPGRDNHCPREVRLHVHPNSPSRD